MFKSWAWHWPSVNYQSQQRDTRTLGTLSAENNSGQENGRRRCDIITTTLSWMTDLNISFVSIFSVSAARRRRSTMATWIMSMSQDKAFGQWPWIDFFNPNISHMLAAANFHRSSRSLWENYFQLCHDYSCKCRNVRLTALSLTADDQQIAAGRAPGHGRQEAAVSVYVEPRTFTITTMELLWPGYSLWAAGRHVHWWMKRKLICLFVPNVRKNRSFTSTFWSV